MRVQPSTSEHMLRWALAAVLVAMLLDARRLQAQSPGVIYACVQKDSAQVRLVSASDACRPNEARIEWTSGGVIGPQGVPGAAGPQGAAGPAGAKGAAGDPGAAGTKGATGDVGPNGSTGVAGPVGAVGNAGPAGPKGVTGDAGAAGVAGAPGAAGDPGAAGPAGTQGAAGTAGVTGPMGSKGVTGDTGPVGAAGPAGASGAAGSVGPVGAKGATGDAGATGAAGTAGPAGIAGAFGPVGPQGAAGSAGAQGPAGPQGPQGLAVTGPVGARGPAGPKGAAGTPLPSGSIAGSISCQGKPTPAGSLVYLAGYSFTAFTDATGTFQFDHVPAGNYKFVVEIGGAAVASIDGVAVGAGATNLGSVNTACAANTSPCGNCEAPTPYCSTANNECVECLYDNHCVLTGANYCINNECFGPSAKPRSNPFARPSAVPQPFSPITPYASAPRH